LKQENNYLPALSKRPSSKKRFFNTIYLYNSINKHLAIITCYDEQRTCDYKLFFDINRNIHNMLLKFLYIHNKADSYLFLMTPLKYKSFLEPVRNILFVKVKEFEDLNKIIILANNRFSIFSKIDAYRKKVRDLEYKKSVILKLYEGQYKSYYKHGSVKQSIAPLTRSINKYNNLLHSIPKYTSEVIINRIFKYIIGYTEEVKPEEETFNADFLEFLASKLKKIRIRVPAL
jgi:hypothetical protein